MRDPYLKLSDSTPSVGTTPIALPHATTYFDGSSEARLRNIEQLLQLLTPRVSQLEAVTLKQSAELASALNQVTLAYSIVSDLSSRLLLAEQRIEKFTEDTHSQVSMLLPLVHRLEDAIAADRRLYTAQALDIASRVDKLELTLWQRIRHWLSNLWP